MSETTVTKFPGVRERSERMGASFGIEFTSRTSTDLTANEMKEIRKNHHYLTIAWIDYARRTGETVLGVAARTIPDDLLEDLFDVCKFHTQLPIRDCPATNRWEASQRKRLVAAILRFADELDIQSTRVSLDTVKSFSLPPENAVYWWMHNRTNVNFVQPNEIALTVRLAPPDYSELGEDVHRACIVNFRRKNLETTEVLVANRFPIVVRLDSYVTTDEYAEVLPPEIARALREMQSKEDHNDAHNRPHESPSAMSELRVDSVGSILVVEDDKQWRSILIALLSDAGFAVAVATRYGEGAETLYDSARDSDACIVDLSLSYGDEVLVGRGILDFCDTFGIPTIVVSARLDEALRQELYREYGVAACFDKNSFVEGEFLRLVHGITGNSQMRLHLARERLMDSLVNSFRQTLKVILPGGTSQVIGLLALRQLEKIADEFDKMHETLRDIGALNDIFKLRTDIRKTGDRWLTESLSAIELGTQSETFGTRELTAESKQSFLDRHLRSQQQELERQHAMLTRRIDAIETDLLRSLDSERKLVLSERKVELVKEREQISGRITEIEMRLTQN